MDRYIGLLTRHLIDNEAFQPVSAEWYGNEHLGAGVMLGRQHWGNWHFVRILPADQLDERDVEQTVAGDEERFHNLQHQTRSSGVMGIIVLVFAQGVSPERREKLLSFQQKAFWQNNYTLVWVADLLAGRVWKHQGRPWRTFLSAELLAGYLNEPNGFKGGLTAGQRGNAQSYGEGGEEIFTVKKQRKPVVTRAILVVNALVWLLMTVMGGSTNPEVLVFFGAKYPPLIIEGQYWRLFTSMFLHIGVAHLLFNSYALYQLGTGAEYLYGSKKFALIYLVAGLWGSVASFLFSPNISAGASGAIFGLFGAFLYFGRREPQIFARGLGNGILAALLVNLAFGFVNPGIDNYAHVGGLFGGYLTSAAIGLKGESPWRMSRLLRLLFTLVLLVGLFMYGLQAVGGGQNA
ncbi:MAG: rhomboid family intramembrane serine protease [Clostridia bacterium]|nr:rhomboid family intramembrane serine protease [Clostridia bacterium]